jgi:protein SCO1/2
MLDTRRGRLLTIGSLAAVLAVLLAAGGYVYVDAQRQDGSVQVVNGGDDGFADPGSVPIGGSFELVNDRGETVTPAAYDDVYKLVFFGFTHCPDVCPTTLADITRTMELLGSATTDVQPLFISVDPARDTPEALREYLSNFHPKIVGLTGTRPQVQKAADAFRVYFEKAKPKNYTGAGSGGENPAGKTDYLVNHSANIYLMSPDNQYLKHFNYGTEPDRMARTIRDALETFGRPERGAT